MDYINLIKNLFKRNCSAQKALDIDFFVAPELLDLEAFREIKGAKDRALDLLVERFAIERIPKHLQEQALVVWWRRFYLFTDKYPQCFPEPVTELGKDTKKVSLRSI